MATMTKGKVKFEEEASQGAFGYVKGTAKWAELLKPGLYGTYGIKLYGDDVLNMETELKAMQDSAVAEIEALGKKYTRADLFKEDDDGNKFLAFKLDENNYEGKPNKISMYDASGTLVEDWDKLVGNGSIVKIKYRIAPYYMTSTKQVGISFKFYAVQVIKLVEYSEKGDSGFGDESDGSAPFDTESEDF